VVFCFPEAKIDGKYHSVDIGGHLLSWSTHFV